MLFTASVVSDADVLNDCVAGIRLPLNLVILAKFTFMGELYVR